MAMSKNSSNSATSDIHEVALCSSPTEFFSANGNCCCRPAGKTSETQLLLDNISDEESDEEASNEASNPYITEDRHYHYHIKSLINRNSKWDFPYDRELAEYYEKHTKPGTVRFVLKEKPLILKDYGLPLEIVMLLSVENENGGIFFRSEQGTLKCTESFSLDKLS
eukprot:GHVP01066477.1.p1 GENE.GHVP01066477.1~~GHVP01066477.1.p1  ORF type:complete len:166 (-),score=24.19 GHVP01066477.1:1919-2416(-)